MKPNFSIASLYNLSSIQIVSSLFISDDDDYGTSTSFLWGPSAYASGSTSTL
jgi:hypothetical protein